MDIEALKLQLIQWLAQLQDPETLAAIENLKRGKPGDGSVVEQMAAERTVAYDRNADLSNVDWYACLTAEQKASIDRAKADIDAGRSISSKELWMKYGKAL